MKKSTKSIVGVIGGLLIAGLGVAGLVKKNGNLVQEFEDNQDDIKVDVVDLDEEEFEEE